MISRPFPAAVVLTLLVSVSPLTGYYCPDPDRDLTVTDATVALGELAEVQLIFDQPETGFFCRDTASYWNIGVCHDPSRVAIVDVVPGEALEPLPEPDFSTIEFESDSWQAALIFSLAGSGPSLPVGTGHELYVATYEALAPGDATLALCDPPLGIIYFGTLCSDQEYVPELHDGTLTVTAPVEFLRGDANQDGGLDLFDPIMILNWFFVSGPPVACRDAADVNDNGVLEGIVDPVALLQYLFISGPAPAPPHLTCGSDPTPDAISCEEYAACP